MELKIDIEGVDETIFALERKFGKGGINKIVDKALLAGAEVIKKELERNFETFKQTGASKDEITISEPMTLQGKRTVLIYWKGPKNRWSIIHLNEWGTIHNPNPRGKGAIERSLRAGEAEYMRVIAQEIGGSL